MATRTLEIIVNQTGNAAKGIDSLTDSLGKVEPAAAKAKGGTSALSGGLADLAGSFGLPLGPAALVTAGIAAAGAAIVTSVNAAREGRAVQAQLAAVLESTGHAAGISQAALNEHAEALQKVTNFDDEAVGSAQALLLTFTKIGGAVLPEATKTVLDMSVALGQDLKSSSIQVGKALNDPINGVTALRRVGVSFTEDQQKMIASLVETGDLAGAQALILKELNTEFGGSAAAAREADGGFIALGNSVANLAEAVGSIIMNINDGTGAMSGLISVIDAATSSVNEIADAFSVGLPQGFLTMIDNSSLLLQALEELGIDVIPEFTNAAKDAAEATNAQAGAHGSAAEAAAEQAAATAELTLLQADALTDLAKLDEAYNEKKEQLLDNRLKAESDASTSQADNYKAMNEKLNEIDANRGKQTTEEIDAKKKKVIAAYNEENVEIQNKLTERQNAIDEQLAKEKAQHEEKAAEIKRLMALQVLEQSGQLEELTGIAGITAQQYMDAVAAGAISANREVETQAATTEKSFEGAQKRTAQLVKENQDLIKRLHGETTSSIVDGSKRATDSIVTDYDRQARAAKIAYDQRMSATGSTNYSSTRRNTDWGPGMAQGGSFVVPPGFPNDSFPMWVESGEHVTVIPRNKATNMPEFATGTNNIYVKPGGGRFSKMSGRELLDAQKKRLGGGKSASSAAASSSAQSMASTASATPIASASPRSMGGGGGPINITIQYNPTVSLANQYELVQALKPAFEELARFYGLNI
jgi:phage-related minor tail protein